MAPSKQVGDPAEFLMTNSKYHDCYLNVGNPKIHKVETIGVTKLDLIAHSPVFRDMFAVSKLDPSGSNTIIRIRDVSPATFKLMLRYVYGGKLPKMTPEEAADLALCAYKYNIQRLVEKAAKRLKPITAEDVFPAFMCVAYMNCPDLELCVSKIIQQQTDQIVKNPKFLLLDENCLLFIVKQSILNINELELWNNLVRWGENQVEVYPENTLRSCLNKILQHVRFLSLTSNEILEHVLPKNILTSDEFMDLSLAVSKKQTLQSPGLCKLKEKRGTYKIQSNVKDISGNEVPTFTNSYDYYSKLGTYYQLELLESKPYSTITFKPSVNIEIKTFTVHGVISNPNNDSSFNPFTLTYNIVVYKSLMGHLKNTETITSQCTAVPNEDIVLEIKKTDGQPLVLEAKETYNLKIQTKPPLPVYKLYYLDNVKSDKTTSWFISTGNHFNIKFEDPFHVLKISYRT